MPQELAALFSLLLFDSGDRYFLSGRSVLAIGAQLRELLFREHLFDLNQFVGFE